MKQNIIYTWNDYNYDVIKLALMVAKSKFKPNYIVGLYPNVGPLAEQLSNLLECKYYMLNPFGESNCWMAEDAFGFSKQKNILVVSAINNKGGKFKKLINDWEENCCPDDQRWKNIWHVNVQFATLFNNDASDHDVEFSINSFNTEETPIHIHFPWDA